MQSRLEIIVGILILTAAGYWIFPGHTWLQSDTQIYVPMLERLWNPSVLSRDFMVEHPHMAFTIYDEVAVGLRRLTGLGFHEVLAAQQFFFRAVGLLGVYLIVSSLGLGRLPALLATGVFTLGATIWGPTVLTIEYEPVPRGFALPLMFLAIGLMARGHPLEAGGAAAVAFLYHGTTTIPYWICAIVLALWPGDRISRRQHIEALVPLAITAAVLGVLSLLQPGRASALFNLERLDPWWEQTLRLRATYVWVSMWFPRWWWHYGLMAALGGLAFWRIRRRANMELRVFLVGLPVLGLLSIPLSYLLLEVLKSSLAPQIQPLRAVLFITAFTGIMAAVAGLQALLDGKNIEGFLWLAVTYMIPTGHAIQDFLLPDLRNPLFLRRLLLVIYLAVGAGMAAWGLRRSRAWARGASWGVMLMAYILYPAFGKVENYPLLHTSELKELCEWAGRSTPIDSLFLFPDARRDLYPGIFRATALRAVYVDWKSGGQANYQRDVARIWRDRWQAVMARPYKRSDPRRYAGLGVDYVVLRKENRVEWPPPVFENAAYVAYKVR